jgi:hypothetical protein
MKIKVELFAVVVSIASWEANDATWTSQDALYEQTNVQPVDHTGVENSAIRHLAMALSSGRAGIGSFHGSRIEVASSTIT